MTGQGWRGCDGNYTDGAERTPQHQRNKTLHWNHANNAEQQRGIVGFAVLTVQQEVVGGGVLQAALGLLTRPINFQSLL